MLTGAQKSTAELVADTAMHKFNNDSTPLNAEQCLVAAKRLLKHIRTAVETLERAV